jgi:hypothetical protein
MKVCSIDSEGKGVDMNDDEEVEELEVGWIVWVTDGTIDAATDGDDVDGGKFGFIEGVLYGWKDGVYAGKLELGTTTDGGIGGRLLGYRLGLCDCDDGVLVLVVDGINEFRLVGTNE